MNELPQKFDIDMYTRPGFDLVIELDDEVEYLLDTEAIASIKNNEPNVVLKRLIDSELKTVTMERIIKALQTGGPVDRIKTK